MPSSKIPIILKIVPRILKKNTAPLLSTHSIY